MTKTPVSIKPELHGWYVCWLYLSERPVVLYWGSMSTEWRAGATLMPVVAYMGPLPE